MTNKLEDSFGKYTKYYTCLEKYGIEKDGRLCHSNYLTAVAESHFHHTGDDHPVVNVTEIEQCYSDPEINIPHESLICDL
jgi:hypothetical protein